MNFTSRRGFLTTASATAASTAALGGTHAKAAPSDRTTLCIIGVRGRGMSLAREFARLPNAQITHICDINRAQFEPAAKAINEIQKSKPQKLRHRARISLNSVSASKQSGVSSRTPPTIRFGLTKHCRRF